MARTMVVSNSTSLISTIVTRPSGSKPITSARRPEARVNSVSVAAPRSMRDRHTPRARAAASAFAAAARAYLDGAEGPPPRQAAFAVAAPVRSDAVRMTNHVWGFSIETVQGDRYVWCRRDGLTVLLNPDLPPAGTAGTNVVLYSEQLAGDVEKLREHGVALTLEHNCYGFTDPDGNRFQLVDPGADHSGGA